MLAKQYRLAQSESESSELDSARLFVVLLALCGRAGGAALDLDGRGFFVDGWGCQIITRDSRDGDIDRDVDVDRKPNHLHVVLIRRCGLALALGLTPSVAATGGPCGSEMENLDPPSSA
jgi:hypothetical protein